MKDRELSPGQGWLLCLLAIGMHILPLVLADLPFIDDVWRSQLAGQLQDPNDSWTGQGRLLAQVFHGALGFGTATVNLYPLPLLIAAVVSARALAGLAFHYFEKPTVTALLVVIPLWYNPFFLQNLSYQYDGPVMALALAASVMAITLRGRGWRPMLGAVGLVAAAACLYQVSVNVFASLCCIEIIRQIIADAPARRVMQALGTRLVQLLGGCVLYRFTGFLLIDVPRTAMLPLDTHWPGMLLSRLQIAAEHVGLLITPGVLCFVVPLLFLAGAGLAIAVWRLLRSHHPWPLSLALAVLLLALVVAVVLLIPGMSLLFDFYNQGARLLMGFGPAMVLVLWLAHRTLVGLSLRLGWLVAIPLLSMLSFSYAYGRVLVAQKALEQAVSSNIAQAIQVTPGLQDARRFYIHAYDTGQVWLPAASGSFEAMPALRYVLTIGYRVLPEMMPRLGMPAFGLHPALSEAQVLAHSPLPVVEQTFFSIYRVGDTGYVFMKPISAPETFHK
ncbi:glucosyltransferase domain-containing protein [Pseudomonas xanthosomatis]|uniref:glucosyltransferase domain-containing protein n=1 Tax=Pseudomonas xanthosomatis TaxID=2842356 RepID=UPI0035179B6D